MRDVPRDTGGPRPLKPDDAQRNLLRWADRARDTYCDSREAGKDVQPGFWSWYTILSTVMENYLREHGDDSALGLQCRRTRHPFVVFLDNAPFPASDWRPWEAEESEDGAFMKELKDLHQSLVSHYFPLGMPEMGFAGSFY